MQPLAIGPCLPIVGAVLLHRSITSRVEPRTQGRVIPRKSLTGLDREVGPAYALDVVRMRSIKNSLRAFWSDEQGEIHVGFTFIVITFAASFPLGFAFVRIYHAVCAAGGSGNLIIGLF